MRPTRISLLRPRARPVVTAALLSLTAVTPRSIHAQAVCAVRSDSTCAELLGTVRVWKRGHANPSRPSLALLLSADSLVLTDLQMQHPETLSVATLERIERLHGYSRSIGRTALGFVLGASGGVVIGALAGMTIECGGICHSRGHDDYRGLGGLLLGGMMGGIGGAAAGIGWGRREVWVPVWMSQVGVP